MVRARSWIHCSCLVATLLLTGCSTGCNTGKANSKALEQRLSTDVPLRSTSAQVLAYLNSQKIEHSKYQHTEASGNSIEASFIIPAPRSLMNPTYDVLFRFDDKGLLDAYEVQYLGYIGF